MSHLFWTQVADTGTSPRNAHAMAYDSQRQRVVLFGGYARESASLCGDTWEWDGKHWTQRQDMGPGARSMPGMAYDSLSKRGVLFGGFGGVKAGSAGSTLADTWELFERP